MGEVRNQCAAAAHERQVESGMRQKDAVEVSQGGQQAPPLPLPLLVPGCYRCSPLPMGEYGLL